jgi:hypothetical protein
VETNTLTETGDVDSSWRRTSDEDVGDGLTSIGRIINLQGCTEATLQA